MNSDEPALVPQWLQKGGPPGSSGGHNYSSTSQFASRDTRSRPKREAPITGGRPGSTATRDSTFGRSEREAPRRDRALHDSWQASSSLGGSSSSYRPAAAGRGSRTPPERLASDNGRSSLDHRDSFGPSTSSSSSRGVFRTHSGPPLRDREDFGFGSSASGYHDSLAFKPTAARGTVARGSLDKPPFDRDFPSLAGRSNVGKSWHSGAALPEQQWTRLADAPDGSALSPRVSNPRAAELPLAESTKPSALRQGSGPVEVPAVLHPRMADTVQQAVSQTSTPAPSASKARLEELVMRQTKQLIPVVASASSRDKAKGKGTAASGPKHSALAATGGVSGMGQGIGRSKAGLDTAKRGEDAPSGPVMTGLGPSIRRLPSGDPKATPGGALGVADGKPEGGSDAGDSLDGQLSGSAKQPAAKDVERQRSSFFQSLRRTSAKNSDSDKTARPSSPSTPPAQTATPVNPPLEPQNSTPQPNTTSTNGSVSNQQNSTVSTSVTTGHDPERRHSWDASDPRLKVSAEEEAFLRSLGWTEAGDDEDEALTEEEIAAFKANTQHLSIKSFRPTSQSFTGFSTFSPRPKMGTAAQNGVSRPGQLDALSSSDSDSDC
ncbi:hypothetical protein ABBQ32_009699 [Trebouxia sp. C0010 RCD-2024]